MMAVLLFCLFGALLRGAQCERQFMVTLPKTVETIRGSCVTIPCSFEIKKKHDKDLTNSCKALWVLTTDNNPRLTDTNATSGDLTQKNCTTTFNNMRREHSQEYRFRVLCDNDLKWTFTNPAVKIVVKDSPPSPTLTPSKLEVKEGTSVHLNCSAPAPCLPHPPTLTWSPSLGESVETLRENGDKTKVKTSVLTFTASKLHHGLNISCSAVYKKQDGSLDVSTSTSLTASVLYGPQNTRVSVRPSGPVPERHSVTLTCRSDAYPPIKNYSWYRADGHQDTFIGTGPGLTIEAFKLKSPFFCKAENEMGVECSNSTEIDVQFPPQILPSSHCIKTTNQVNCSCETVGNPPPTLSWDLDGQPVNQSNPLTAIHESVNGTALRSIISMDQPQQDASTFLCRSFNSLGSASHQFHLIVFQISADKQDDVKLPVLISAVGALFLVVCVLLFVISYQRNQNRSSHSGDVNTAASAQHLEPDTKEEDIYVNANKLEPAGVTHSATDSELNTTNLLSSRGGNAEEAGKGSERNDADVVYSTVNWKLKKKKEGEKMEDLTLSDGSYVLEEKCVAGNAGRDLISNALEMGSLYEEGAAIKIKKEGECEYAQVQFRKKQLPEECKCSHLQHGMNETQGAQCERPFMITLPKTVEAIRGSCVTIPCSFDIKMEYDKDLTNSCKAQWVYTTDTVPKLTDTNATSGDLTQKNCTTTFNNMRHEHSQEYRFRVDCDNSLKWSFTNTTVNIVVKDSPPSPTLTPSKLEVKEGTSVRVNCSAPAPCLPHPPTLTWSPSLGESVETLRENGDKTKVKTSVLTFTASKLHHGLNISCSAVYKKQDGSLDVSTSTSLTASVLFPPQILPSSHCIKTTNQVNCSCETVGNPPPNLSWDLDGQPVNQSNPLTAIHESVNGTALRSIISMDQPQQDASTFLCRSFNSLGSASHQFHLIVFQISADKQDDVKLPVLITAVGALFLVVCVLLFVISYQRNQNRSPHSGDVNTAASAQHLVREGNEEPDTKEEDIYVNANKLEPAGVTHSATDSELNTTNLLSSRGGDAEEASKGSERNDADVVYSTVNLKLKKKKDGEKMEDLTSSDGSYVLEEKCVAGNAGRDLMSNALEIGSLYEEGAAIKIKKEVECEYAQVQFRKKQ
ncbi:uncharacterized protein ACNS7B_019033 [Menidia menidia]